MTRKDYEALAGALKEARYHVLTRNAPEDSAAVGFGIDAAAKEIALVLAKDNPRLNRERFLQACGVEV